MKTRSYSSDNVLMSAFLVMVLTIGAVGGIDLALNAPATTPTPATYTV